jgi:hypothetical protein
LNFGVAALLQPHRLPYLPGACCSAIIHGMKSAKHRGAIVDHSGGARSDLFCRALQP